jgi:thioredoxin reductase
MKTHDYDVAVIGGGPAGLQAALTLGRVHRSVLLLDSGEYRNDAAQHMHNFVTQDGTPPAEFRAAAREQLKAYDTVELRDARVSDVKSDGDAWSLEPGGGWRACGQGAQTHPRDRSSRHSARQAWLAGPLG